LLALLGLLFLQGLDNLRALVFHALIQGHHHLLLAAAALLAFHHVIELLVVANAIAGAFAGLVLVLHLRLHAIANFGSYLLDFIGNLQTAATLHATGVLLLGARLHTAALSALLLAVLLSVRVLAAIAAVGVGTVRKRKGSKQTQANRENTHKFSVLVVG
jgi:hypothetical protein